MVLGAAPLYAQDAAPVSPVASQSATAITLADAVARAGAGPAAVQVATLRAREAERRRSEVRAALLPTLSADAVWLDRTYNSQTFGFTFPGFPPLIGPVRTIDARVRATQALFATADWLRVSEAGEGVHASSAERRVAIQDASQAAAAAWVRAARARLSVVARQADLSLATELAGLAQQELRAGTGARIDVIRARTQETTARGLLQQARNELARAEIELARAVGGAADAPLSASDTLREDVARSQAPEDPQGAVALALARRADLAAEEARLAQARRERTAIGAERLPRVDVAGDYGASGVHFSDALATYDLQLSVSVPLFDGARREARMAEQGDVVRESQVRAGDLREQIAADVRNALLQLASGRDQEAIARERLDLAEQELAQARERFRNGVAGNIEVIDAQSSLLRARDADIDARAASATARINLARAVGVAETLR